MVTCELCGKDVTKVIPVKVAGSIMQACANCERMGSSIENKSSDMGHTFYKRKKQDNLTLDVIPNYSPVLNSALAKKGITLHHLARALNIKESTLNKYFTNKLKPDVLTAKKLENYLGIKLLEEFTSENIDKYMDTSEKDSSDESLSLGDLLIKKMEEKRK